MKQTEVKVPARNIILMALMKDGRTQNQAEQLIRESDHQAISDRDNLWCKRIEDILKKAFPEEGHGELLIEASAFDTLLQERN